jgi:hypothetical protein
VLFRSGCAGVRIADYLELERDPELPRDPTHVVMVDPPPFSHLDRLARSATAEDGYLHRAWGEAEWRLSCRILDEQLVRRPTLIAAFRDLRDAGEVDGEELRDALRGSSSAARAPEVAARCFRVLEELGLVQGAPDRGRGTVGVVSSKSTDLERSGVYRAYSERYEEGRTFLERQRQP